MCLGVASLEWVAGDLVFLDDFAHDEDVFVFSASGAVVYFVAGGFFWVAGLVGKAVFYEM